MPRLLLVDDNPSIHRIAESLLAPTDVELVCAASAAEALDRLRRGERFDVALVDTAMPGMDGWTLLDRLRGMEETARMPIALMAGVLDPVDPSKLAQAPIQGFLKKPIELRELGDRVKALLATPVLISPSAFSTVPAIPAKDLVMRAGESLPEFRPDHAEIPTGLVDVELDLPEPEDDLLVLTAEDLWPEDGVPAPPAPVLAAPAMHDLPLDLEELDFEGLQDLTIEPLVKTGPPSGVLPEPLAAPRPEHVLPAKEHLPFTLSSWEDLETVPTHFIDTPRTQLPEPPAADDSFAHLPTAASLLGLGGEAGVAALAAHAFLHEDYEPEPVSPEPAPAAHGPVPVVHEPALAAHEPAPVMHEPAPVVPVPEPVLPKPVPVVHVPEPVLPEPVPVVHVPEPVHHEPAPVFHEPVPVFQEPAPVFHVPAPAGLAPAPHAFVPVAGGQAAAVQGHGPLVSIASAPVSSEQAQAMIQAVLADPGLVDVLAKALVARLGDQVLREIAWEVMPDLAGRLQR